jgi:ABC-type branched-subunit amino acid transport system substrate-binding protein
LTTRPGAFVAAVLSAFLLLASPAVAAATELPQPLSAGYEPVPAFRPDPRDAARTVPIAALFEAESDFLAGKKEEALRKFLEIAYSAPDGERKGYVWMRVGELLLDRGEFEKALEAADKAVLLSRARFLVLTAMELKLRIYRKMEWSNEARQVAGYLIDQKYVNANVPALLALMARADARAGKLASSLALYRKAVASTPDPEEANGLSTEREFVIDRATDLAPILGAAMAEEDPDVRAHLFLALGKAAARKGFHGMAKFSFERASAAGGRWARDAAEPLFRVEKIVSGRPKIVGLVPLSGKLADIGFSVLSGAEIALAPGRWTGNPEGAPVIRWVDTSGQPEKARAAFSAAAADRTVIGFLGPVTGEEGRAVSAAFGPKSPPLLYLGQKEVPGKPFLYGFGLSPVEEARAVLGLLAKERMIDLLLLYPENGYGRGFADAVARVSAETGVRIAQTIGYPPDSKDFTEVIRKAVGNAKFRRQSRTKEKGKAMKLPLHGIVIADRWDRVFLLASQLNYYNVYLPLAGFSGWYSEELLRKAGNAVAGAVFSVDYSDAIPGSQGDRFRKEYQGAMNTAPTRFEAMGYDGATFLAESLSVEGAAGKPPGESMRERIPRLKDFTGVTGAFLFGPAGDMRRKVSLLRIDLGNFVPVATQ